MAKTAKIKSKSPTLRYEYTNFYYTKKGRCMGHSVTMYKTPSAASADGICMPGETRKIRRRLVGEWEDIPCEKNTK